MKTLFFLLSLAYFGLPLQASSSTDTIRFGEIRQLTESNRFRIEADKAYPMRGRTVDLFSNRGYLTVNDTVARGFFPFFGRAYSLPYGEGGSIEFDAPVEDRSLKIKGKRKNKTLLYRFSVRGKNDIFRIQLLITSSGSCQISIYSNQRSQISYSGHIYPIEP